MPFHSPIDWESWSLTFGSIRTFSGIYHNIFKIKEFDQKLTYIRTILPINRSILTPRITAFWILTIPVVLAQLSQNVARLAPIVSVVVTVSPDGLPKE